MPLLRMQAIFYMGFGDLMMLQVYSCNFHEEGRGDNSEALRGQSTGDTNFCNPPERLG